MNNTITEMKTTLEGIHSRITEAEEWISDVEGKIVEITTAEQRWMEILPQNIYLEHLQVI